MIFLISRRFRAKISGLDNLNSSTSNSSITYRLHTSTPRLDRSTSKSKTIDRYIGQHATSSPRRIAEVALGHPGSDRSLGGGPVCIFLVLDNIYFTLSTILPAVRIFHGCSWSQSPARLEKETCLFA
jgi:hypothetical protein